MLYNYGCMILPTYKPTRFTCKIENISLEHIISIIKQHRTIDLSTYEYEKVERESTQGFSMKWHMDDRVVVKIKKECILDPTDICINDQYKLSKRNKDKNVPIYSVIVYLSDYNKDFTCGEFEFVDEIIMPKKNVMIFLIVMKYTEYNLLKLVIEKQFYINFTNL